MTAGRPGNAFLNRRDVVLSSAALLAAGMIAAPASAAPPPGRYGRVLHRPKLTLFMTRADGVEQQAFAEHWLKEEAPRLGRTRGLASLAFNVVDHPRTMRAYNNRDTPYDGIAELEFVNEGALDAWSRRAEAMRQPGFVKPEVFTLVTSQVVLMPAQHRGKGQAKRIGLVGRAPGKGQGDFFREWRDVHGPEVIQQPALQGYILNLADASRSPKSEWDGYAELWWPDWATYDYSMAERYKFMKAQPTGDFFHTNRLSLVEERYRKSFA